MLRRRPIGNNSPKSTNNQTSLLDLIAKWIPILGFVAGIAQFELVNFYIPSTQTPGLVGTSELSVVGQKGSMTGVKATVHLHNAGNSRVYIVGSWFNVFGSNVDGAHKTDVPSFGTYVRGAIVGSDFDHTPSYHLERFVNLTNTFPVSCGRPYPAGDWLDPSEDQTAQFIFYIPKAKYDVLRLTTEQVVSRDARNIACVVAADSDGTLSGRTRIRGRLVSGETAELQKLHAGKLTTVSELLLWPVSADAKK